jgi:hypothetical protein
MEEVKLCECGCGKPAPIAKMTSKRDGYVKGLPIRFINGHSSWRGGEYINSLGYTLVYAPEHPRQNNGHVYAHILKAEKALGKTLPEGASVHHFPSIKNFTHLVICQDHCYHMLLEKRMRAFKACGQGNWRRCRFCKKWDAPENLILWVTGRDAHHRSCYNDHRRKKRAERKTGGEDALICSMYETR